MSNSKWLKGKWKGNGFEFEVIIIEFKITEFELAGQTALTPFKSPG